MSNLKELKEKAKSLGIKYSTKMSKAQLKIILEDKNKNNEIINEIKNICFANIIGQNINTEYVIQPNFARIINKHIYVWIAEEKPFVKLIINTNIRVKNV